MKEVGKGGVFRNIRGWVKVEYVGKGGRRGKVSTLLHLSPSFTPFLLSSHPNFPNSPHFPTIPHICPHPPPFHTSSIFPHIFQMSSTHSTYPPFSPSPTPFISLISPPPFLYSSTFPNLFNLSPYLHLLAQ